MTNLETTTHISPYFLRALAVVAALAVAVSSLVALAAKPAEAAFPGRNGKIVFESTRSGGPDTEIFIMNKDGSGVKQLTDNKADDTDPVVSANGRKIAFVSLRDGNEEIYTMKIDGTNETNLTNSPKRDITPTWSPDGLQIAFASDRETFSSDRAGNLEIFKMDADGFGPTQLTNFSTIKSINPAWSPDGQKIAYEESFSGPATSDIVVMRQDGTNQTFLTFNNPAFDAEPSWSPNGKKIVFTSNRDGNFEIYTMDAVDTNGDANGENQTRITKSGATIDSQPAFSPNGKQIAFSKTSFGSTDIFKMRADGSNRVNLTKFKIASQGAPDWQPLKRR